MRSATLDSRENQQLHFTTLEKSAFRKTGFSPISGYRESRFAELGTEERGTVRLVNQKVAVFLLISCVVMFSLSVRAIVNTSFRDSFLRDSRYLKPGTRITKASAVVSSLWWAVVGSLI